jgi:hypothetical protein
MSWSEIRERLNIWSAVLPGTDGPPRARATGTFIFDISQEGILQLLILIFRLVYWARPTITGQTKDLVGLNDALKSLDDARYDLLAVVNSARRIVLEGIDDEWNTAAPHEAIPRFLNEPWIRSESSIFEEAEGVDGFTRLTINKRRLIKIARTNFDIGLKDAKEAVEAALKAAAPTPSITPPSSFIHIKNEHLYLDRLISLPADWLSSDTSAESRPPFRDRDEAVTSPDYYTILEWYWDTAMSFADQRQFTSKSHFVDTTELERRNVVWLRKDAESMCAIVIGDELLAE